MTDDHTTVAHVQVGAGDEGHGAGDHGDDHGHDDYGHLDEPLGPVDVVAWGACILGVAVGLVTAFCFALSTGLIAA